MGQSETCSDVDVLHADIVDKVKKDFPSNQLINTLSDFFKIFGNTTRVKIMCALDKSEMCVGDTRYDRFCRFPSIKNFT